MNSDDDETPRYRGRPPRQLSDSQRDRRVYGVPVPTQPEGDITDLTEILDWEPDEQIKNVVARSRRESGSTAYVEDLLVLNRRWERKWGATVSEAKAVIAMLPSPTELKEIRAAVAKVGTVSTIWKLIATIAVAAASYVVKEAIDEQRTLNETVIRMKYAEEEIKILRADRYQRPPAQKDPSP